MAGMNEITGYDLSRNWFDWCFENTDLINPNHTALYFFIIEHCNRMGWKEKFGLPTEMSMSAVGIKNWRTYKNAFEDLANWGFIKVIERSKNQYSATVIALVKNTKANTKALSKAIQKHGQKHYKSIVDINKPINHITNEPINLLSADQPTPGKNKCEYWKSFVAKWEEWYLAKMKEKYSYQGKDFKSLKSIHKFFKNRAAIKKTEFTEDNLLAAFDFFLNKAWDKDDWLRQNFSIPNLLSQFNQIANGAHQQATSKNNGGGTEKGGTSTDREQALRAW